MVTNSQRTATIIGRLAGMAASMYFWFILGTNYPPHQSIFSGIIEQEKISILGATATVVVTTLILMLFTGFISRLLFSFRDG
jgi:hypothetical protein